MVIKMKDKTMYIAIIVKGGKGRPEQKAIATPEEIEEAMSKEKWTLLDRIKMFLNPNPWVIFISGCLLHSKLIEIDQKRKNVNNKRN